MSKLLEAKVAHEVCIRNAKKLTIVNGVDKNKIDWKELAKQSEEVLNQETIKYLK